MSISRKVQRTLEPFFRRVACFGAEQPWRLLACSVLVFAVLTPGLLLLDFRTEIEVWLPQYTDAFRNAERLESLYGQPSVSSFALAVAKDPDEGLLHTAALLDMMEFWNDVVELPGYRDVCEVSNASCVRFSVLGGYC